MHSQHDAKIASAGEYVRVGTTHLTAIAGTATALRTTASETSNRCDE